MRTRRHGLRRLNERGVSLMETLVALSLFAIAAGTMGDFLVQQIRMASTNHNFTSAYALAEQELEDVRALDYVDIVPRSSTKAVGSVTFNLRTDVVANTPAPNMKSITVSVDWNEPGGARNVALHTIYTAIKR
jgi:prepilin-type N-terminal cleavage/methylation domain-containing protein